MFASDCHTLRVYFNDRMIGRIVDGCPESTGECQEIPAFWHFLLALGKDRNRGLRPINVAQTRRLTVIRPYPVEHHRQA